MNRIWAPVTLIIALAGAPAVVAQTVGQSITAACPDEPMSIYYASGETALSTAGQQLVARLVDHAIACRPDGIDLVTRINSGIDGDRAVELALARLSDISRDFVARGVSPDTIRVAARPGDDVFPPGMGEVEVIFRKTPPGAGEASRREPVTPRLPPSDAV